MLSSPSFDGPFRGTHFLVFRLYGPPEVALHRLSRGVDAMRTRSRCRRIDRSTFGAFCHHANERRSKICWKLNSCQQTLAQFPNFAKTVFNGDNYVVTFFLVIATVGIGAGSMLCNSFLKGELPRRNGRPFPAGIDL
jgi:hypothetical protein